jgi:hypothetical protein
MKVTNINGTSDNTCKCGSWLKHWEKYSGISVTYCSETSCLSKDIVGAHVQKADSDDKNWYIVPLCKTHNASDKDLDIGSTKLISANTSETCAKK